MAPRGNSSLKRRVFYFLGKEAAILNLILVRHGESLANVRGVYQGQTVDTGLTRLGRRQALLAAQRLKKFGVDWVYTRVL